MINYDFVIVGAGLSGCVLARQLADHGKKILIIEKRNHIGGNLFDYLNDDGIIIQKYGPHTFHTNNDDVINFIMKYAKWDDYSLKCEAVIKGISTPSPFNFKTIDQFYSVEKAAVLKEKLFKNFGNSKTTILQLLDSKDDFIKEYANFLYENDYSLYTSKQWGILPTKVDKSVLKRVPVEFSYKDKYFYDKFEAIPSGGFTNFINNLLNSKNIVVELNQNALKDIKIENNKILYKNLELPIIFTGPVDELFNFKFGPLPYRSLKFELIKEDVKNFQNVAIVAYPSHDYSFTRITECTKIPHQNVNFTYIIKEYPLQFDVDKNNERYYPILTDESKEKYFLYSNEALLIENLHLLGRLAEFNYYNMDECVNNALKLSKIILREE